MGKYLLNKKELGQRLKLTRDQIDTLIDAKLITTVDINGRQYVTPAEADAFVARSLGK
jgi:hypothetical protein